MNIKEFKNHKRVWRNTREFPQLPFKTHPSIEYSQSLKQNGQVEWNYTEAMSLRVAAEASLTIGDSSASEETRTWTASENFKKPTGRKTIVRLYNVNQETYINILEYAWQNKNLIMFLRDVYTRSRYGIAGTRRGHEREAIPQRSQMEEWRNIRKMKKTV